jgi:hypothetical protein
MDWRWLCYLFHASYGWLLWEYELGPNHMLAELRHATDEWNMKKFWKWRLTTFGIKLGMSFWWSGNIILQRTPLEKSRVFDTFKGSKLLTFRVMTSSRREVCEDWYCKWRNKNMRILAWRWCLHKSYITSVSEEISCPILEAVRKRKHLGKAGGHTMKAGMNNEPRRENIFQLWTSRALGEEICS